MKKLILLIFVVAASLNAQAVQGQIGQVPVVAAADNSPVGGAGNLTTVGSVPYVSASGILNQDAGQFFWDATNNRLGIGTTTPAQSLEVSGGAIIASGYGNRAAATGPALEIGWTGTTTILQSYNRTTSLYVPAQYSALNHSFDTSGSARMTILGGGNVGIGTTTPGYKLEVAGSSNTEIARVGDGTRSFGISTYTPNSGGVTFRNAGTGLISLTTANAVLIGTGYAGLGSGVAANTVAIEGNVGIGTTTPGQALDVLGSARVYSSTADAAILFGSDQVDANSAKISYNRGTANLDITPRSTYATNLAGKLKFSITNSTGAGSALLGANSPAITLTAPYTWITVTTSDGSTGYMPIWK